MNCGTCPEVDRSAARTQCDCGRTEQVRAALDSGSWRLPTVDAATLRHCYCYLSQSLSMPCVAWYPEPTDEDGGYPCTVMELIDPATGLGNKFDGLFCKVRQGKQERNLPLIELELSENASNGRVVERYRECFWRWR